jgi:uncharacterized membrane protein YfcA
VTPADAVLVAGAGFLAGAVNAVAGGGTLLSYPALLLAGLSPVTANTTSSVGLVAGYAGGSVAYRRELSGQSGRARGLLISAALGGIVGAALLLLTPGESFEGVVPYLVLVASLLLALQPRLAKALEARGRARPHPGWEVQLAVGLGAVYGGYFGAGLGVMLLAVLGLLVPDDLQRLNALKGVLSLLVNLVGAVVFVAIGRVDWTAAGLLAVGAVAGATVGVAVARRLPASWVRTGVVVAGTAVAVTLLMTG